VVVNRVGGDPTEKGARVLPTPRCGSSNHRYLRRCSREKGAESLEQIVYKKGQRTAEVSICMDAGHRRKKQRNAAADAEILPFVREETSEERALT